MAARAHHFAQHAVALRAELKAALPRETLRALHRKQAGRHFLVAGRQAGLFLLAGWGLVRVADPIFWIPLAVVQGFTVFNFTVLLHEVVHHLVFARPRPRLERWLAWLYALPSGLSPSQFAKWHLDHHAELGSPEDDPKRRHLSPRRNARWYKLLYCTPALFVLYFRAARREAGVYPRPLQRRIAWERRLAVAVHLAVLALLGWVFGPGAAFRAYLVPVFFVFPVAFTLNRLGQHYNIDPADPARWGTLMRGHWFWDFAFLNSNYHLEHHYFPGVPLYRLPALQRALEPFYARKGMTWQSYGRLLYGWFVENRAPHTDWSAAG